MSAVIPATYAQWRHCIEIDCGLALTRTYIDERLAVWRNDGHPECVRFARLYGPAHLENVRTWFEQARRNAI
jgi:hypothetical protein